MKTTTLNTPFSFESEAVASDVAEETRAAWIKFVFTDDQPNGNKQGVPKTEFDNLVKTGRMKPVKGLAGDHRGAVPIGAIAQLEAIDNQVLGIASIWETEFPDEVARLRQAHAAGQSSQLSWEILYQDSTKDDNGVEWLSGCVAKAVTLVDNPAYQGRTPILAIAEQKGEQQMDELKVKLEAEEKRSAELAQKLAEAQAGLEELLALKQELDQLRSFKAETEKNQAREAMLTKRLGRFGEAGLAMTREQFEKELDKWESLDDNAFEFVVSMLINTKPATPSTPVLPNVGATASQNDPKTLVKNLLAELHKTNEVNDGSK